MRLTFGRILLAACLLVVLLGAALGARLRAQAREDERPIGGSAVVDAVEIAVSSPLGGTLRDLRGREGDAVAAGQRIAELECEELESGLVAAEARASAARASAAAAAAAARTAGHARGAAWAVARSTQASAAALAAEGASAARDLDRAERLYGAEVVPQLEVDRSQTRVAALRNQQGAAEERHRSELAAARAAEQSQTSALESARGMEQLAHAAEAAVAAARAALRKCSLAAPRAGVIQRRNFEPGETVPPGAPVVTLAALDEVRARFYVPTADLGKVVPGDPVTVHADPFPDRVFRGSIRVVSSEAEFTPRNIQTRSDRDRLVYAVEIAIPNPGHALRPGMPVEVRVESRRP